jgi:hypothetical protein
MRELVVIQMSLVCVLYRFSLADARPKRSVLLKDSNRQINFPYFRVGGGGGGKKGKISARFLW